MSDLLDGLRVGWESIMKWVYDISGFDIGAEIFANGGYTADDLLMWIFGTAADLSGKFLTWVQSIKWGDLSRDIAAAISGLNWADYGADFGKMASNLWKTIATFLFGGKIVTGGGTADMQTKIVQGIDWRALGIAIGTAFADAVIGGLTLDASATFKSKVLDVFAADSKLLQSMIDNYGTGKIIKVAWDVLIVPNLTDKFFLGASSDEITNAIDSAIVGVDWGKIGADVNKYFKDHLIEILAGLINPALVPVVDGGFQQVFKAIDWGAIGATINIGLGVIKDAIITAASGITQAFHDAVVVPLGTAWNVMINAFILDWNMFLIDINKMLPKGDQIPYVQFIPNPYTPAAPTTTPPSGAETTPITSVPGATPSAVAGNAANTVNYNVTVNNATDKPTTTLITDTLTKLSYLGAA
jgi:hypothetical protein